MSEIKLNLNLTPKKEGKEIILDKKIENIKEELGKKLENVKFIKLYRAEGETIDESKLNVVQKNSVGRWFSNDLNISLKYQKLHPNSNIYELCVPEEFYKALLESTSSEPTEIKPPKELASLKSLYIERNPITKDAYIKFLANRKLNEEAQNEKE